jgi:hypothetical protein
MYERRTQPLASRRLFLRRFAYSAAWGMTLIGVSLFAGMAGYRFTEGLSWLDAFVNAAMLLGGMGPVDQLHSNAGKLFAGFYALYCGLVVIIVTGITFAPVVHRFLHRFHLEKKGDDA